MNYYKIRQEVKKIISERIRELREQYNYSQSELADKLNIARTSVLAWENQTSVPAMKHIIALAKLFRVTTDYILEVENKRVLSLDGLSDDEISLICGLLNYFDNAKE